MRKILTLSFAAVAFWTAVAFICVLPLGDANLLAERFLYSALPQWWAWGLLAPGILAIDYFLPVAQTSIWPRIAMHLCVGPFITLLYWYLTRILDSLFGVRPWSELFAPGSLHAGVHKMFWNLLIYALIVGVWQAYLHRRRFAAAQLEMVTLQKNCADAQLHILRMQLDPHFLFNALNTVSSQVERDPRLARRMIEHLGDLLRLSLQTQGAQEIPFADELGFLDHYLAIQRIRFGDTLTIAVNVEAGLAAVLVPSLFLQPLIENAIRHGISHKIDGGAVVLNARRHEENILIEILDDGVGLPPNWTMENQAGIGLAVTRERFAGLHPGNAHRFDVSRRAGGGTAVAIAFPARTRPGA